MEKGLENNHIDHSRREIWKFSEKSGRTARHPFAIRHLQDAAPESNTPILRVFVSLGGSGEDLLTAQGVKMEIWAWLLVTFVIASLVLAARNI